MRRRYRWAEIAALARSTPGVWRQHPDLIAVTLHTEGHARRRVYQLQPDNLGRYRISRGFSSTNDLGERVFDLRIRYDRNETDHGDQPAQGAQARRREVPAQDEDADRGVHLEERSAQGDEGVRGQPGREGEGRVRGGGRR